MRRGGWPGWPANDGTQAVLRSFGPVLRPGGRLLVVASRFGMLGHLNPRLRPLFERATLNEVEAAVRAWRAAIHAGDAQERGWPRWLNVPSKVAQVAAVRAVARERRDVDLRENTLVAAVCPGLVDTEASRPWFDDFSQVQTPDEAAAKVLDVVFRDDVEPELYGELIRFGKALPWLGGTPPEEQDRLIADRTGVASRGRVP